MSMVNPLRCRDKAIYADGSEPELSGRGASARYGAGLQARLAAAGGKPEVSGFVPDLMLGEVADLRDMVAFTKHRDTGLAGQLNIRTKAMG